MTSEELIALVETYFAAVDAEDLEGVLETLSSKCVFTVETHGVQLEGIAQITGMFRRLWASHRAVRHVGFVHAADPTTQRIATRFKVENTETDGSITHKSNCNFFEVADRRFKIVAVYMAGSNTLLSEDQKMPG